MKQFKTLIITMLCCFSIMPFSVYANETNEIERDFTIEVSNEEVTKTDSFTVDVIEDKREKENNTVIKVDSISKKEIRELLEEYTKNTNKGVSSLATPQSNARGTVIENVGTDNKEYPIRREITTKETNIKNPNGLTTNTNTQIKERPSSDARQFLTFKSKSGKVFHLIINHDESDDNVQLLTEVSEADLLNMIETKEVKETPKVEVKQEEKQEVKVEAKKENNSLGTYVILGLVLLGVLGSGYYFKIVKPKQEEDFDFEDENEEDDFFSEENTDEKQMEDLEDEEDK